MPSSSSRVGLRGCPHGLCWESHEFWCMLCYIAMHMSHHYDPVTFGISIWRVLGILCAFRVLHVLCCFRNVYKVFLALASRSKCFTKVLLVLASETVIALSVSGCWHSETTICQVCSLCWDPKTCVSLFQTCFFL